MSKLIMLQGLPGSGKSTWADDRATRTGAVVVNKDDIRRRLTSTGWEWSHEGEREVVRERDSAVVMAFAAGAHTVISTDTNFSPDHRKRLESLAAMFSAEFEVVTFPTPVEECVRRDAERPVDQRVGVSVIHGMVRNYGLDKDPAWYGEKPAETGFLLRYTPQPGQPWAILVDIDGTIALRTGRDPYDITRVSEDIVNVPVKSVVTAMHRAGYEIVYMSGRDSSCRDDTRIWLFTHGFPDGKLFMRPKGDSRSDSIVKGELFDAHVRGHYNVQFALDDRQRVVDFWRSIGLTCLQVAPGDF